MKHLEIHQWKNMHKWLLELIWFKMISTASQFRNIIKDYNSASDEDTELTFGVEVAEDCPQ